MLGSVRHTSEELTRKQASMGGGYRLKLVANRKVAKLSVNSDEGRSLQFFVDWRDRLTVETVRARGVSGPCCFLFRFVTQSSLRNVL